MHANRNKTLKVTFLELPSTVDGQLLGPPSRDVYSLFTLPTRTCELLTAIAKREGYTDTVTLTPAINKKGRLTESDWNRLRASDVIGISVITRTAPPSFQLAQILRREVPRAKILFGGPHVSALPEEALMYGDVVVMNEGDHTIVELLERFEESLDSPHLADVRGISYKEGEEVITTSKRPFLTCEELDALPFPVYSPDVRKRITHQPIVTSRGCPHGCEYCSVIQNFGRQYRFLSEERIMELIRHQLAQTRTSIFFSDDNFTSNKRRVKSLLDRILSEDLKLPRWQCQCRVEAAFDDTLLDLMTRAGNNQVMIGFESVSNETLKLWKKASTLEKNIEAIRRFQKKGIAIHGMFILGSDVDTVETIEETIAFAKRMNIDTAQFFALTPLPGTPLTKKLNDDGRVLTRSWHLYDAQHVVIQPAKMSPAELQDGVVRAFRSFYSPAQAFKKLFVKTPHRIQNSLIRILGRRLVHRIIKETSPHRYALDELNDWLQHVNDFCKQYNEKLKDLGTRFSSARAELTENIENKLQELPAWKRDLLEGLEKRIEYLQERFSTISSQYHPFCKRLLNELYSRYYHEAEAVLVDS